MFFTARVYRLTLIPLTVAFLGTLPGCQVRTSDRDLVYITPIEASNLPQREKGGLFSKSKSVAFVDARSPDKFAAGHIQGAVLLPFADMRDAGTAKLESYDVLVVYASDYDDTIAVAESKRLIELGHSDVRTLTGGLKAWEKDGFEVASGLGDTDVTVAEHVDTAIPKPAYGKAKKK